ncbi:MAG: hypothetical protein GF408_08460 [Candidatus Omnitrophica bacterium]|nr:hypothetical protein [Candidatus Omnitrophota bacterium]
MITKIGLAAGDIWNYLEKKHGSSSFSEIVEGLGLKKELALMSLGWLAREGHIVLDTEDEDFLVRLNKK